MSSVIQLLSRGVHAVLLSRYTILASYAVCFYDWIISLDQEVAFIYPAQWNIVKSTYIFCRYYPIAISPFHLWGLLGNHEKHVCETYYRALYACAMPTMLSAQLILMLRTYAFSGRNKRVLAALLVAYLCLVGFIIFVISKQLSLPPLFIGLKRSGCFAVSNQEASTEYLVSIAQGTSRVKVPISYNLGLISVLATIFDFLNMFIVIRHCVKRGTLGPLGQSVLKQGILVYVFMTALNVFTMASYFSSYLVVRGFAASSAFATVLPSALSCRLVLMLRRKASPAEFEARLDHSQMVNEALEMMAMGQHPEDSEISRRSMSTMLKPTLDVPGLISV